MTKSLVTIAMLAAMALAPVTAVAKNKNGHCPPGLAKKSIPCVPPGQAKKIYRNGDFIRNDYRWVDNPYRYGLNRNYSYIRAGDYVYRVDPDTRKVLNLIGAVADILN
ncbi:MULTISPECIES: hypothetical protein [unclassified Ruegeria]|uniref:hypothetical protein n=1 Tax=unclassified Ruegeria TaxID=2625375 RepID=UPI0014892B2A|nr:MULTISPECIES: hypothetical protein [unclassified Ruegeria]NOD63466.1 hypothetical protein [Ruegeria sp. HKCCD6109]